MKMSEKNGKLLFLIIISGLILCIAAISHAQDYKLLYAKKIGGTGDDMARDSVISSDGSVIVIGSFSKTVTFGSVSGVSVSLTSVGEEDIFIAKYGASGELIWAKRAGGTKEDVGTSIDISDDGTIFITGYYTGTATFGKGENNQTTFTAVGDSDIFVAKINANGQLAWAKTAGGYGEELCNGISAVNGTYFVITGRYWSTAVFGDGESKETELSSEGAGDIFIAKYKNTGSLEWAKSAGGGYTDEGMDIKYMADGTSFVTGYFQATGYFGKNEANAKTLYSRGSEDIFVAKFKSTGVLDWVKSAGGTSRDMGYGITVLSTNRVIITGVFQGTAIWGDNYDISKVASGGFDSFLAGYGSAGAIQWVRKNGSAETDQGLAIAVTPDDRVIAVGTFSGTCYFNYNEDDEVSMNSIGAEDIYIAGYQADGDLDWIKKATGNGTDRPYSVDIKNNNAFIVCGYFGAPTGNSVTFGKTERHETTLPSSGTYDCFFAEYNRQYNFFMLY